MLRTKIVPVVAPAGTVTVRLFALAAVTVAFVAPKKTMLFAAVVLKLLPLMVTEAPTAPFAGPNELIAGAVPAAKALLAEKRIKAQNKNSLFVKGYVNVWGIVIVLWGFLIRVVGHRW